MSDHIFDFSREAESRVESEKRRGEENDSCYRNEMQALKTEQLEIYSEFREMCDTLKKKEIEILNKNKQVKCLSAEWKEKEESLQERILTLEKDNSSVGEERKRLQTAVEQKGVENDLIKTRLKDSEDHLQRLYDNLSRIEGMFYEAKRKGMYT